MGNQSKSSRCTSLVRHGVGPGQCWAGPQPCWADDDFPRLKGSDLGFSGLSNQTWASSERVLEFFLNKYTLLSAFLGLLARDVGFRFLRSPVHSQSFRSEARGQDGHGHTARVGSSGSRQSLPGGLPAWESS